MNINRFLALSLSLNIVSLSASAQVFYPPSTNYFTHATVPMESAPVVTYDSPTTRPVAPTIPPNAAHGLEESSAVVVPAPRNTPAAAVSSSSTIVTTPRYSYPYTYPYGSPVTTPIYSKPYSYGSPVITPSYSYRYGGRVVHYQRVYGKQVGHYGRVYGKQVVHYARVERPERVVTPVYPQPSLSFPNVPVMIMPAPVNGREAPRGAFTRFMTTPPTVSFTDELPVIVTISY